MKFALLEKTPMSQSNDAIQEELAQRKLDAVDVSGAFDNCFFHSYALYLLANNYPLPEDLFRPNSQDTAEVIQLKTLFQSPDDLNLFDNYVRLKSLERQFSNYYFEKTLVLGVLFRSWFTNQLLNDANNRDSFFSVGSDHNLGFVDLVAGINEINKTDITEALILQIETNIGRTDVVGSLEERLQFLEKLFGVNIDNTRSIQDRTLLICNQQGIDIAQINIDQIKYMYGHQVLYLANADFFNGKREIKPTDNEAELRKYWQEQGYANYCKYLSSPGEKVSSSDVIAVLDSLGMSHVVHNQRTKQIIHHHTIHTAKAPFELAFNAGDGHYFLLKTETTREILEAYSRENDQYRLERELLLSDDSSLDKIMQTRHEQYSLLLAATLPAGNKPFTAFLHRVKELHTAVGAQIQSQPVFLAPSAQEQVVQPSSDVPVPKYKPVLPPTPIPQPVERVTKTIQLIQEPLLSFPDSELEDVATPWPRQNIIIPAPAQSPQPAQLITPPVSESPLNQPEGDKVKQGKPETTEELLFDLRLKELHEKLQKFEGKTKHSDDRFDKAAKAAAILHESLSHEFNSYLTSSKSIKDYRAFEKNCTGFINDSKSTLESHRGFKRAIWNIILGVAGIGVLYAIAGGINYGVRGHFLFFNDTRAGKKVAEITESVQLLAPRKA